MFLRSAGFDKPGCGFTDITACRSIQFLLDGYKSRTSRTWIYNVVLHTDNSFVIDKANFQWLDGIGKLDIKTGEKHTRFTITYIGNKTNKLSVTIQNLIFSHVTMFSISANLEILNCTLNDGAIQASNSLSLTITGSLWTSLTTLQGIKATNIQKVTIHQSYFTYNLTSTLQDNSLCLVYLFNISYVDIREVTVSKFDLCSKRVKSSNMFVISSVNDCVLDDVNITNNKDVIGIKMVNVKNSKITNGTFKNTQMCGSSDVRKGVLIIDRSKVHFTMTDFIYNEIGTISSQLSMIEFDGCVFNSNSNHHGYAGAITSVDCQVIVRNSTFENNSGNGGAVDIRASGQFSYPCYLQTSGNTLFYDNKALKGGAVHVVSPCYIDINETNFSLNKATLPASPEYTEGNGIGAAIYIETMNIHNTEKYTQKANMEASEKVHMHNPSNTVVHRMRDSILFHNQANFLGGGIFIGCRNAIKNEHLLSRRYGSICPSRKSSCKQDVLLIDTADFNYNTALYGGGIVSFSTVHITQANFTANQAALGGAAFVHKTECNLTDVRFRENTGYYSANALYADRSTARTNGCLVKDVVYNNYTDTNVFGTVHQIHIYNSILTAEDFHLQLELNDSYPQEISMVATDADLTHLTCHETSNTIQMTNLSLTCPTNFRAILRTSENLKSVCKIEQTGPKCVFYQPINFVCE